MNRAVLIVGPQEYCKQEIELNSSNLLEIDGSANIQEIKNFRNFLYKPTISGEKVAVIYGIQKLPPMSQAVLLKVLENLPNDCKVFLTASYMPSFTIKTRCITKILYGKIEKEEELIKGYKFIKNAFENSLITQKMLDGWYIILKTTSWIREGSINQDQKNTILKDLGF